MRKVLLATTALAMMGGVSAAYADISVSGGHELKYQSWSKKQSTTANNSKISSGATYTISGSSVLDNGMTISGKIYSDNVLTVRSTRRVSRSATTGAPSA